MKTLIVYAHPNPKSFCHTLVRCAEEELEKREMDYLLRDLYLLEFDAILAGDDFFAAPGEALSKDIVKEQQFVSEADLLVFIYPIWWFSMPAILKGWVDRVFSEGFAFAFEGKKGPVGLLKGKRAALFNTTGGSEALYTQHGYRDSMLTTIDKGIFRSCGIDVVQHRFFYAVPASSPEDRAQMIVDFRNDLARLLDQR